MAEKYTIAGRFFGRNPFPTGPRERWMRLALTRAIVTGIKMAGTCLLCIGLASAQARPQATAQPGADRNVMMAQDAFKDVQVLKGISVKEFMETMGFFAASLNANCTTCH